MRKGRRMADMERNTLLLVEDSEDLRASLSAGLQFSGFEVMEVCDGVEALKLLRSSPVEVSLIITDLMMPKMDGWELITQIRKDSNLNKIPVLILTALTANTYRDELMLKGANAYLQKPIRLITLVKKIQTLLESQKR